MTPPVARMRSADARTALPMRVRLKKIERPTAITGTVSTTSRCEPRNVSGDHTNVKSNGVGKFCGAMS